jgi:undecaprenyl-diphosphatase
MGWDNPLDRAVLVFVDSHRSDWATSLAKSVMWLGTTPSALAGGVLLAAVAVVALRAWRPAAAAVGALVAAAGVAAVLKAVFQRPRPPADLAIVATGGFSFPSTQAMETAAITVALLLALPVHFPALSRSAALRRTGATILVGASLLVAVCMVYLGAHWPTDVLAGWALGGLIGWVCGRVVGGPRPRPSARPAEPEPSRDDAARVGRGVREEDGADAVGAPRDQRGGRSDGGGAGDEPPPAGR